MAREAGSAIPVWSPDLPPEQKDEVLRTSLKEIRSSLQQKSTNILVKHIVTSTFTSAAAALTIVPAFSKSFVVSGGLTDIILKGVTSLSAGTATLQLLVDGVAVDMVSQTGAGSFGFVLVHKDQLPDGQHTVTFKAAVSGGGTITFGIGGSYTSLWVTEVLV